MAIQVLVVDDDPKLRSLVLEGLEANSIEATPADSVAAAKAACATSDFDLILLDVMMPDASGWDFIEELRAGGDTTPVIFVTALGGVEDRVKGLRLGGDDYLIKPFAFEELLARIEAVVRRHSAERTIIGDLEIDALRRRVTLADKVLDLSPREYGLLVALIRAEGRVLSRSALLKDVWGIDFDPGTNVVDVHIGRLRKRFGEHRRKHIVTVTGEGYRFEAHPAG